MGNVLRAAQLPTSRSLPRQGAATIRSVIGPDLAIAGNLESAGEVQVHGEVQGDIKAERIVVGAQGHISGALIANEIVVGGSVIGSVRGNDVTFQTGSHIEADVFHRSLTIEQGAFFEGKSRRSNDPMSVVVEPAPAVGQPSG